MRELLGLSTRLLAVERVWLVLRQHIECFRRLELLLLQQKLLLVLDAVVVLMAEVTVGTPVVPHFVTLLHQRHHRGVRLVLFEDLLEARLVLLIVV